MTPQNRVSSLLRHNRGRVAVAPLKTQSQFRYPHHERGITPSRPGNDITPYFVSKSDGETKFTG